MARLTSPTPSPGRAAGGCLVLILTSPAPPVIAFLAAPGGIGTKLVMAALALAVGVIAGGAILRALLHIEPAPSAPRPGEPETGALGDWAVPPSDDEPVYWISYADRGTCPLGKGGHPAHRWFWRAELALPGAGTPLPVYGATWCKGDGQPHRGTHGQTHGGPR